VGAADAAQPCGIVDERAHDPVLDVVTLEVVPGLHVLAHVDSVSCRPAVAGRWWRGGSGSELAT
jgi:hypothetical protein